MENASTAVPPSGGGTFLRTVDSAWIAHQLPHEKLVWMLRKMCETRHFEEKAEELYTRGLVHGTMHLSIGMEASPIGSIGALEPDDLIIHHHRGHGHTIDKGADITVMMSEFLGKEPGYCRGRGGSMHIADMVMETGTFVEWFKQEGQQVVKGEPLFTILTDKAAIEIESPASGILAGVSAKPNDVIPVSETIAYILAPGERQQVF